MASDRTDEFTTDGEIQDDMKGLIERLWETSVFRSPFFLDLPDLAVERPSEFPRFPLDAEHMEVFREIETIEFLGQSRVLVAWPTASVVEGSP